MRIETIHHWTHRCIGIDNIRHDDLISGHLNMVVMSDVVDHMAGHLNRETESVRAAHRVVPEACERGAVGEDQPLHQLLRLELLRVRRLPLDQCACDIQERGAVRGDCRQERVYQ